MATLDWSYPRVMTSQPPQRRSRIAEEMDKVGREAEPQYSVAGQPAKRRGVFTRIKDFAKDLLVRQTSTKR